MPTYTLITVTYGGVVSHARGFATLRMCQEARSIALTGMTIADNEAADVAYRERCVAEDRRRRASHAAQWLAKHPPRPPTPAEREGLRHLQISWRHERPLVCERLFDGPAHGPHAELVLSTLGADGLVHDHFRINGGWSNGFCSPSYSRERGEDVKMVRGDWVKKYPTDIRTAHCVIELPDAPETGLKTALVAA